MGRKVSREKYVIATFITLGIFLLGLLLGLVIENKRVEYIQHQDVIQKLEFSSLQLQYAYLDQLSQEQNCPAVQKTFEQSINSLESTRIRLENYNQDAKIDKEDFELLKREYILAQIRYWLFARRTKEICNTELVTVLYFFSDTKICPNCDQQAFILTYLKKLFGDKLLIFSFDERYGEEPMISILKRTYRIDNYPTLIVENRKYSGLTSKDDLLREICQYYSTNLEVCEGYEQKI